MTLKGYYEDDLKHIREYLASIENGAETLPHETDVNHLLWLNARLDDGIPYTTGGIAEQPNWYIEDMKYLSTLDYAEDLPYLIANCAEEITRIDKKLAEDMQAQAATSIR